MGVEELIDDAQEFPVGEVTSDKKLSNIKGNKIMWKHLAAHDPYYFKYLASDLTLAEGRRIVELLDMVIQGDIKGVSLSDKETIAVGNVRDTIVEEVLKK